MYSIAFEPKMVTPHSPSLGLLLFYSLSSPKSTNLIVVHTAATTYLNPGHPSESPLHSALSLRKCLSIFWAESGEAHLILTGSRTTYLPSGTVFVICPLLLFMCFLSLAFFLTKNS